MKEQTIKENVSLEPQHLVATADPPASLQRPFIRDHCDVVKASCFKMKTKPNPTDVVYAVPWSTEKQADYKFNLAGPRWPIGGQHAMQALLELDQETVTEQTDSGLWQQKVGVSVVLYDPTNATDLEYMSIYGKSLNVRWEATMKEAFIHSLIKYRSRLVTLCNEAGKPFVDGNSVEDDVYGQITKFCNMSSSAFGDYWRVMSLPAELYDLVLPLFKGEAKNRKGKTIKAPTSGSHFAVTTGIPYVTLKRFITNLVKGAWTGQAFLKSCKNWKYQVKARMSIACYIKTTYPKKMDAELKNMIAGSIVKKKITKSKKISQQCYRGC